ncbi:hypothetical protein SGRA_3246 [Saprospira grandis str. Lewin]|uniref:Uncharacterized protein n=1 Tax=Saprospira grandis (strain Lewin) TaxID=984262 RepID=H6KZW7_SAPGL|nr:hypothetical protein SGRA_3246 [Saprospira grandis str. Lewin]
MSGPALRSRGRRPDQSPKGCRAEQTCERRSIAAASKAGRGPQNLQIPSPTKVAAIRSCCFFFAKKRPPNQKSYQMKT